jgi:CBS domain containing-hemolysin-like protein
VVLAASLVFVQHLKKEPALPGESSTGFHNWLRMCFRRLARVQDRGNIEKEIEQLIDEGEQQGLISEDEGEMIQGIFSFRDMIAREIMVPRTDVAYAPVDASVSDITQLVIQSGHSRIPIYEGNIDNIIGILHAKDLLGLCGVGESNLRDILRRPQFIPETKKISDVLKDLRESKSHIAIVIDEYGGMAGVLTLEDIIEEIIGDIVDEYDADENLIVEHEDGSVSVHARVDVEELEDHFGVDLPDGKFESVGGFVMSLLGRVPDVGERVVYQDLEMVIEAANDRKIEKIRVQKLSPESAQLLNGDPVPSP